MSNVISDVQVYPLKKSHPKIKANGTLVVGSAFKIKFTLFNGPKGLFVGFPGEQGEKINEKTGKKEWYPYVSVIDDNTRKELQKAVVGAYNKKVGNDTKLDQGTAAGPTNQTEDDDIPF